VDIAQNSGRKLAEAESNPQAAGACARCHGAEETGPRSDLVPVLHGQPAAFLTGALQAYADGTRASGIMRPVASDLDEASIARVAEYYAGLAYPSDRGRARPAHSAAVERGRTLATQGDPGNVVPACNACHGDEALASFPRLAGQNAAYMRRQLELWQRGLNATNDSALIMAPIARRLSTQQVRDAAAYYASLAVSRSVREGRK
jgi:cytochrome c553